MWTQLDGHLSALALEASQALNGERVNTTQVLESDRLCD